MSVGTWMSLTVTVNVQAVELPAASVAVNVTEDVPTGKVDPLAKGPEVCATVGVLQLSVAAAAA